MRYINDINICIDKECVSVFFETDKKINVKALESYYFIPKVFKAIENFSKSLGLSHKVIMNNERWDLNNRL